MFLHARTGWDWLTHHRYFDLLCVLAASRMLLGSEPGIGPDLQVWQTWPAELITSCVALVLGTYGLHAVNQ